MVSDRHESQVEADFTVGRSISSSLIWTLYLEVGRRLKKQSAEYDGHYSIMPVYTYIGDPNTAPMCGSVRHESLHRRDMTSTTRITCGIHGNERTYFRPLIVHHVRRIVNVKSSYVWVTHHYRYQTTNLRRPKQPDLTCNEGGKRTFATTQPSLCHLISRPA